MKASTAVTMLAALAQETRLSVFRLLVQAGSEGLSAGDLSKKLSVPAPTLSFHLKELMTAKLANSRQEGRFVFYSAVFTQMNSLLEYLTENCCGGVPCFPKSACRTAEKETA